MDTCACEWSDEWRTSDKLCEVPAAGAAGARTDPGLISLYPNSASVNPESNPNPHSDTSSDRSSTNDTTVTSENQRRSWMTATCAACAAAGAPTSAERPPPPTSSLCHHHPIDPHHPAPTRARERRRRLSASRARPSPSKPRAGLTCRTPPHSMATPAAEASAGSRGRAGDL